MRALGITRGLDTGRFNQGRFRGVSGAVLIALFSFAEAVWKLFITIINIIAPVFIVIGAGFLAVKGRLLSNDMVDGLNRFVVLFAIPCLLFNAISSLDLKAAYDWRVLAAFYSGATINFFIATLLAMKLFHRPPGEAVAIGFGALFSNLLLIGLSISERAYGAGSLAPSYAIISLHAPFCYLLGITAMEFMGAKGATIAGTARIVAKSMVRNSLMIGIGLGFAVNLAGIALPGVAQSAVDMMSRAALPAALFGLGGVLTRYAVADTAGEATMVSLLSLLLHPGLTYVLCLWLGVSDATTRSVVLLAAMAPGVNAYLFATMYNKGVNTAASAVTLATALSVVTVSIWLWVLGS